MSSQWAKSKQWTPHVSILGTFKAVAQSATFSFLHSPDSPSSQRFLAVLLYWVSKPNSDNSRDQRISGFRCLLSFEQAVQQTVFHDFWKVFRHSIRAKSTESPDLCKPFFYCPIFLSCNMKCPANIISLASNIFRGFWSSKQAIWYREASVLREPSWCSCDRWST